MPTYKEDGVILIRMTHELLQFTRVLPELLLVLEELHGEGVVFCGFDAGRVEGCFTTCGGGYNDSDVG